MPEIKQKSAIPIEIAIEITSACNLNCKICLSNSKKQFFVPFSKIKEIVDEAKSLGIEAVRVTGGEPLMHKDIIPILEYIKSKGLYSILNTNAILLNEKVIEALEHYLDNILVSLQGYNSSTEERLTKGGIFFKKKLKILAKLARSKISMVRTGTIISRILINNLDKYKLIFTTLGIKNWIAIRPMPAKGIPLYKEYKVSKKDILKVMNYMLRLKKEGINTNIGNAIPFCITKDSNKISLLTSNGATEGQKRIIYDIDGFFKPSHKINVNIGKTIKEALRNPFLRKIKSLKQLPKKCQKCTYLKSCFGGSRYLANESNSNYFGPDPWMPDK
jgi:radical SAM protein with 4Fe4S-binding SPASM domain